MEEQYREFHVTLFVPRDKDSDLIKTKLEDDGIPFRDFQSFYGGVATFLIEFPGYDKEDSELKLNETLVDMGYEVKSISYHKTLTYEESQLLY